MRKFNGCIKGIYLENILKKKIIGKKKAIKLFFFLQFLIILIKIVSKLS